MPSAMILSKWIRPQGKLLKRAGPDPGKQQMWARLIVAGWAAGGYEITGCPLACKNVHQTQAVKIKDYADRVIRFGMSVASSGLSMVAEVVR